MNISVIGTGYVGLVTGACLAKVGHDVVCMDIDEGKIKTLNQGISPIYEPGIEELLKTCINQKKISFTTDLALTVQHADAIFLALPTPPGDDGSADLSYILTASQNIAPLLRKYTVIINKSTVPVGSADKVENILSQHADRALFDVVSNPEFLREGKAIDDFLKPDRIVVGVESQQAQKIMQKIYAPLLQGQSSDLFPLPSEFLIMDRHSSEMTKYVANTFLAMKISFINEISRLCEDLGADVEHVKQGIATDHRIGSEFLNPGIGYGGSCFPKDVLALEKMALQCNEKLGILPMILEGNKNQRAFFLKKIQRAIGGSLKGKTVALWGLAFKPDTDDVREAPALEIIAKLVHAGAHVRCHDPEAMRNAQTYFEKGTINTRNIMYAQDPYEAVLGADALVLITEWDIFVQADFEEVKQLLKNPLIIDGRNCLDGDIITRLGMKYVSIGRADKE